MSKRWRKFWEGLFLLVGISAYTALNFWFVDLIKDLGMASWCGAMAGGAVGLWLAVMLFLNWLDKEGE